MPNYVWINTGTSTVGTLTYASDTRECDCFDLLDFAIDSISSGASYSVSIAWYDPSNVLLYTDTIAVSAGNQQVAIATSIKGYYVKISFNNAGGGGTFQFALFVKFVRV